MSLLSNLKIKKSEPTKSGKRKKIIAIVVTIFIGLGVISYIGALTDQSNLERDNVSIIISEIDDEISMDYHTTSREISAKVSGVSTLARAEVAGRWTALYRSENHISTIKYEIKDIPEGDTAITVSIQDGKRHNEKTITLKRQTKADYDQQELKKALERAEESTSKAESDPSDDNISDAKSDIENLPEDKRQPFTERIAILEKIKQEEKEERERKEEARREAEEARKAQEAADDERKQQEAAAAAAREQQRQQQGHQSQRQSSPPASSQQSTPSQYPQQNQPTPSRPSYSQPAPSANLPLKAICRDGTVQYQDSPDLPNYRGMCSGHGGIAQKLGRIP